MERLAVDEAERTSLPVEDREMGVDAEGVVEGGDDVFGGDGIGGGMGGEPVLRAEDLSPPDAAAGHDQAEATGPVVAAAILVEPGGPPELPHHDHEGLVEQAAEVEVFHEGG